MSVHIKKKWEWNVHFSSIREEHCSKLQNSNVCFPFFLDTTYETYSKRSTFYHFFLFQKSIIPNLVLTRFPILLLSKAHENNFVCSKMSKINVGKQKQYALTNQNKLSTIGSCIFRLRKDKILFRYFLTLKKSHLMNISSCAIITNYMNFDILAYF